MSQRKSFCVVISTLFLVLLSPVVASAQYTRDDVFAKLRSGFGTGDVASIVEGMPQSAPVQLDFPELSLKRFVGRNVNATAVLELVFKDLRPVIFVPRPGWDEELKKSKTDIQCIIRGQWRIKVGDKSLLRELYITLRNDQVGVDRAVVQGLEGVAHPAGHEDRRRGPPRGGEGPAQGRAPAPGPPRRGACRKRNRAVLFVRPQGQE